VHELVGVLDEADGRPVAQAERLEVAVLEWGDGGDGVCEDSGVWK
jgi:predicted RNA-binding protein with TRAM domain